MRTLKESLLSDLEDTMKDGDDYIKAIAELDVTKKITNKDWESILGDDVFRYTIHCPKWLNIIGLNSNLSTNYTDILIDVTYYEEYVSGTIKYTADIDFGIYDTNNDDFVTVFNLFPNNIKYHKSIDDVKKAINKHIKDNINSKNAQKLKNLILLRM